MRKMLLCLTLTLIALIVLVSPAVGSTLTIELDVEFSGGVDPESGVSPWVTITLDDSVGGPNTVQMTLEATNLTGGATGEIVAQAYLNFDPSLDSSLLSIVEVDVSQSSPIVVSQGNDLFKADGDGFFDILFDLPPPPGDASSVLTGGESIVYNLTYVSAIDASSFAHDSVNGGGATAPIPLQRTFSESAKAMTAAGSATLQYPSLERPCSRPSALDC